MQLIYEIVAIIAAVLAIILLFKILKGVMKISIFILAFALIVFSSWYALSATEDQDLVAFAVKKVSMVQELATSKYSAEAKELKDEIIDNVKEKAGEVVKDVIKSEINNTVNILKNNPD
ncbi:MAG: hypothetical protein AABX39_02330 [Nanoarchaeota archaeon]